MSFHDQNFSSHCAPHHSPLSILSRLLIVLLLLSACTPVAQPTTAPEANAPATGEVSLPVIVQASPSPLATATLPPTDTPPPPPTDTPAPTPAPRIASFAVIGDYGEGGANEAAVAELVKSWDPQFIITVGDNNYPVGAYETMDEHVGQFYSDYIGNYQGAYGPGSEVNRFFPTLGNHDWQTDNAQPYLNYFTLPGNERYYDFIWGPVHFFALDSDSNEPDGVGSGSAQAAWLQAALAASTMPWKVVYMHHPPYSSGTHGGVDWIRWPFEEWGATSVLAGHDHVYERMQMGNIPLFINGVGGGAIYDMDVVDPMSQFRYNDGYGAMRVFADEFSMTFQFIGVGGEVLDTYVQTR